jgi:hypothetical protein
MLSNDPVIPADGKKFWRIFRTQAAYGRYPPLWPNDLVCVIFIGPVVGFDIFNLLIGPPLNFLFGLLVG